MMHFNIAFSWMEGVGNGVKITDETDWAKLAGLNFG